MKNTKSALLVASLLAVAHTNAAPYAIEPFSKRPDAVVDLRTATGASYLGVSWQYADTRIIAAENHGPGQDLKPSGPVVQTHDLWPRAGGDDFDSADWKKIAPSDLEARRGNGKLSYGWYRTTITIPERVDGFEPTGGTAVLSLTVDDYAEVWVNGELPRTLGGDSQLAAGWNANTRIVLGSDVQPGQKFDVTIFAANGPLSQPPENFIWIRDAAVDFYSADHAQIGEPVQTQIMKMDSELDSIIAPGTQIERLAGGLGFAEGPVWMPAKEGGSLLFSDPNNNTIYRLTPDGQLRVFRAHSGYSGTDIGRYRQPGSNGLALDPEGRLTICEHGNRRVTRLENNGSLTVLADRFDGRRLNSPNDLVYRSDGALFFTDPPFGLPQGDKDPGKETTYSGIYCLIDGQLKLVSTDLSGPNGLAFSPDERYLYVGNWQDGRKVVLRYEVAHDGALSHPTVFADLTSAPGEEAIDGVKVNRHGHVFVSGPGGLWIFAPDGRRLGLLSGPELAANFAFGGGDGHDLYLAARTGIYRLRLSSNE